MGQAYWISKDACQKLCNDNSLCNSYSHCEMSDTPGLHTGDCWLKDKIFKQEEDSKDSSAANKCTTYYNTCSSGTI